MQLLRCGGRWAQSHSLWPLEHSGGRRGPPSPPYHPKARGRKLSLVSKWVDSGGQVEDFAPVCSTVWHPSAAPELAAVNESHLSLWKIAESGAQVEMDTASIQSCDNDLRVI